MISRVNRTGCTHSPKKYPLHIDDRGCDNFRKWNTFHNFVDVEQSKNQDLCNGKHLLEIQLARERIRRFHYIPERSVDVPDMMANTLGIDIVVIVWHQDYSNYRVVPIRAAAGVVDSTVGSVELVRVAESKQIKKTGFCFRLTMEIVFSPLVSHRLPNTPSCRLFARDRTTNYLNIWRVLVHRSRIHKMNHSLMDSVVGHHSNDLSISVNIVSL